MKQLLCVLSVIASSLIFMPNASAENNASEALLQDMSQASQSLNYELSFININKQGIDSQRYRHALLDNLKVAQLLQMDGPQREVVQRGDEISYFEAGLEPFTLSGEYIVDALPTLAHADFKRMAAYYDFIPVGRARVADRLCDVLRIVARDGTRYNYIVWIDSESKLLLRADLLDRDGEALEQFRVVTVNLTGQPSDAIKKLAGEKLPPLLSVPDADNSEFTWHPTWLPEGFKQISSSARPLPTVGTPIESRMYSDGLYTFSINVSDAKSASTGGDQLVRSGRRTISTVRRDQAEITVVGELPPQTAKRINDGITFKEAL